MPEACAEGSTSLCPACCALSPPQGQGQLDSGLPCNSQLVPTACCLLAAADQAHGTMQQCWEGQAKLITLQHLMNIIKFLLFLVQNLMSWKKLSAGVDSYFVVRIPS